MKSARIITSLGMLGLVSAQTSVVSLFLGPYIQSRDMVGSIIKNDATATTYSITCPKPTAAEYTDCGLGTGLVLTEGPKTAAYTVGKSGDNFTQTLGCSLDGSTFANCSGTMGGSAANFPGKQAYTMTGSDIQILPVTVTAGSVTSVTGTTTASATETGTATETGSETSTGGFPKVTGNAGIVAGGLAVAVAAAFI